MPVRSLLLLLLVLAALAAVPAGAGAPSVIVSDVRITPEVLMPGDQALISITLTNTAASSVRTETGSAGEGDARTVSTSTEINPVIEMVTLDGGREIRVLGGDRQYRGELGPRQSVTLPFLVQAPPYTGIFFPVLIVRLQEGETLKYPVAVNVNTRVTGLRQPALLLSQSTIGPFAPGDLASIAVSLANAGNGEASDVTLRFGANGSGLVPVGSRTVHLASSKPGSNQTFDLDLRVDRSAGSGLREVPVEVAYTALDGTRVRTTELLGLDLRGRAELAVASVKTDPVRVREGDEVDLVVRMDNTGTGDARAVSARIDLPLSGTREAFVGTVRPGSNAPAVFALTADRSGEFEYTFNLSYEDDWGVHETGQPLHLSVASSGNALLATGLLLLAALAGAVLFIAWWRRRKGGAAHA
ncbi:MAG: hypothetical protein GXY82_04485 [Methanospirillum sp.]|nr:hypothetical protein [Methanospirillum sp.]